MTEESKKTIHRVSPRINLLKNQKIFFKTKKELDKYTRNEGIQHQGFVAEIEQLEKIELKDYIKDKTNLTFACLDEITDPRNIGSIIRSAASFKVDGIIIKERSFPSESKLMYKSASGTIENINIFEVPNINTTLKYLEKIIFGYMDLIQIQKKILQKSNGQEIKYYYLALRVMVLKVHTKKYTDFLVKIKIDKNVESLNVSNSAANCIHYINSKNNLIIF